MFQGGGGLKQLLTATTTNPSRALAAYYATGNMYTGGFPTPASDYASVTRPAATGIGVLAQGAFLSAHAGSDTSSPTKRGLFTYYKLFCKSHLMPPPNVPALDTTTVMTGINTTRDRYEKLHAAGSCATCHKQFDPLGFAFEHFDEGGRYRVKEKTFDINSSGTITAPDGSMINFTDEQGLMTAVANEPIIHECMSAYLAAYAYGSDEACLGASQVTALQSGSIGIAEAFARLARRAALRAAKRPVDRAQPAVRQPVVRQPAVRTSRQTAVLAFLRAVQTHLPEQLGKPQWLLEVADRVHLGRGRGHIAVGGKQRSRESPPAPATAAGARGTFARP